MLRVLQQGHTDHMTLREPGMRRDILWSNYDPSLAGVGDGRWDSTITIMDGSVTYVMWIQEGSHKKAEMIKTFCALLILVFLPTLPMNLLEDGGTQRTPDLCRHLVTDV